MTKKTIRQLAEIQHDLAETISVIHQKAANLRSGSNDLLAQSYRIAVIDESYGEHIACLDGLTHELLKHKMNKEAAKVALYALEFLTALRIPLFDEDLLLTRCHLLAKFSHASRNSFNFNDAINADNELGAALVALLRFDIDLPAKAPGMKGLLQHLVDNTCAPAILLQLTDQRPIEQRLQLV